MTFLLDCWECTLPRETGVNLPHEAVGRSVRLATRNAVVEACVPGLAVNHANSLKQHKVEHMNMRSGCRFRHNFKRNRIFS